MRNIKHIAQGLALAGLLSMLHVPQSDAQNLQGKPMPIKIGQYNERPPVNEGSIADGRLVYERACIHCHGNEGAGKGPVAFFLSRDTGPRPRDFTLGLYIFRSTESGELSLDEDLFRTITRGIVGYMPSFVGLDAPDRWKLVYYIKSLAPEDFQDAQPEPIKVAGSPAPITAKDPLEVLAKFGCTACHSLLETESPIGPNLNDVGARLAMDEIRESIISPNAIIAEGYAPIMPDLSRSMTVRELEMLVQFLSGQRG